MPQLVDFQAQLEKDLQNPNFKNGFEHEKYKLNLQIKINDLLQKTGHKELCVEVLDISEYDYIEDFVNEE